MKADRRGCVTNVAFTLFFFFFFFPHLISILFKKKCYEDDDKHYLNFANTWCVESCATDEYADSSTYLCTKCSSSMANCLTCTAHNLCTSCTAGMYIKSDGTACINDCYTEDGQKYGNQTSMVCIAVCEGTNYVDTNYLC